MTIHRRASASAVLDELTGIDGVPILHWFTGTKSQLKKAIDIGCWFSVGPGMLSTKKGVELVSMMPQNKILTETDGPFTKYKGNPLMPWQCDIAVNILSSMWNQSSAHTSII
ncbi:TatD family hydrolase, partial [Pseudomonas aeruginosa]